MMDEKILWQSARTFDDLCELGARWLEGRIHYHPEACASSPDEESASLVATLAMINRSGFLTSCSQPGVVLEHGSGQRAFLAGIAKESVARRIYSASLTTDLVVTAFPPSVTTGPSHYGYGIPVTVDEFRPMTWAGQCIPGEILHAYEAAACSSSLIEELRTAAWQVDVIDPQWGRDSILWEAVLMAVQGRHELAAAFSSRPRDEEELGSFYC